MVNNKYLHLENTPDEIIKFVFAQHSIIVPLLERAKHNIRSYKGSMQPYQAAVLYYLAHNKNPKTVLEIGTGVGYSTYFLAKAARNGYVFTLNPNEEESYFAELHLRNLGVTNIHYTQKSSREHWKRFIDKTENLPPEYYDFIFVDGDHKDIGFDVNWYGGLKHGGLILFHDYTENQTPVYNKLNEMKEIWGNPHVFIKDTVNHYGMAGWYKED